MASSGRWQLPQTRLDDLLGELQSRLDAVLATRDRSNALLEAVVSLGADLDLETMLRRLVKTATTLADATYGALGLIGESGRLIEFVPVGLTDDEIARIEHWPHGLGLLGLLIREPKPLRLSDIAGHPESYGFPPGHPPMRGFLGVPVRVRDEVFGNLYLTEKRGGGDFDEDDENVMVALATAAGVAIENYQRRSDAERLAILEDRDRIAKDLHDIVIQRLFASAMTLLSAGRLIDSPEVAARVQRVVDDLDETIRQIRSTIFALQIAPDDPRPALRARILSTADAAAESLGFAPGVALEGLVDMVPEEEAGQLLAVLREALSNVARHASATRVDVLVDTHNGLLLRVRDNGLGMPPKVNRSGIRNMAERAEAMGGTFEIGPGNESGTVVEWHVPLKED